MNILACSGDVLYVVINDTSIFCYRLQDLFSNIQIAQREPKPFAKIQNESQIHHIRAGKLSGKNVLVVAGEDGLVKMLVPQTSERQPFKILSLNTDTESTWSMGLSTQLGVLVTGSNGHRLTCIPLLDNKSSHFTLEGHNHNIPCVDISSNGEFVASGSIDTTIRVWHIPSKRFIKSWNQKWEHQQGRGEWVWGVRWIQKRFIKVVKDDSLVFTAQHIQLNRVILGNRDNDHMSVDNLHDDEEEEQHVEDELDREESDQVTNDESNPIISSMTHNQADNIQIPEDELLIVTSKHHVYLLDNNLKLLDSKYVNPARVLHLLPIFFHNISRLSIIEVIPELSLLLIASQSDAKVIMLRIIRNQSGEKYKIIPEKVIPEYPNVYPVAGQDRKSVV